MKDCTDYTWSYFLKEKTELKQVMMSLSNDLKATYCIDARYIVYDNAGENEDFKWLCKQDRMNIKFEYTMPNTLQQNWRVEKKFATIYNWINGMLSVGKFLIIKKLSMG